MTVSIYKGSEAPFIEPFLDAEAKRRRVTVGVVRAWFDNLSRDEQGERIALFRQGKAGGERTACCEDAARIRFCPFCGASIP